MFTLTVKPKSDSHNTSVYTIPSIELSIDGDELVMLICDESHRKLVFDAETLKQIVQLAGLE
jgi:hypothetical protein